jgi:hypothetical protein
MTSIGPDEPCPLIGHPRRMLGVVCRSIDERRTTPVGPIAWARDRSVRGDGG